MSSARFSVGRHDPQVTPLGEANPLSFDLGHYLDKYGCQTRSSSSNVMPYKLVISINQGNRTRQWNPL